MRLSKLRRPADRDRFMVACAIVRLVLASHLATTPDRVVVSRRCEECGGAHGKPRLAHPAKPIVELSVSHSGDRVAVAFALGTPVGIDVEQMQPDLGVEEMARVALTPAEIDVLSRSKRGERVRDFLVRWTRKEAVVKATGLGLTISPASFAVSGAEEPPRLTSFPHDPELKGRLSLYDLDPGPRHVSSLAVIGSCPRIVNLNGSALMERWRDPPRSSGVTKMAGDPHH